MNGLDLEFLLALVLMGAIGASAALAMWLFAQGLSSSTDMPAPAVKVPPHERRIFAETVTKAVALARAGKVDEGYAHMLAARRRALTQCGGDEPWVNELIHYYQRALDCYVARHGTA